MISAILDAVAYGLLGILVFMGYAMYRAVTSGEWDDSNITNWLRVFIHLVLHPGDFFHMYYISRPIDAAVGIRKVFWYLDKDETTEVVKTRPTPLERN